MPNAALGTADDGCAEGERNLPLLDGVQGRAKSPMAASMSGNMVQVSKGGIRFSVVVQRRTRLVWVGLGRGRNAPHEH